MLIDRSKYVAVSAVIMGTMAVMACSLTSKEETPAPAVDPTAVDPNVMNGEVPAGEPGGPGGEPGAEVILPGSSSSSTSSGTNPATDGGAKTDGGANGTDGGAPVCLADNGAEPNCDNAGACSGGVCLWATSKMKKGSAREVVTCLRAIETFDCENEFQKVGDCNAAALKKSCKDDDATALCDQAAMGCGAGEAEFGKPECVALVSGLSAVGRNDFRACMAEGCALNRGCALPH